jgi:hypothetical protein
VSDYVIKNWKKTESRKETRSFDQWDSKACARKTSISGLEVAIPCATHYHCGCEHNTWVWRIRDILIEELEFEEILCCQKITTPRRIFKTLVLFNTIDSLAGEKPVWHLPLLPVPIDFRSCYIDDVRIMIPDIHRHPHPWKRLREKEKKKQEEASVYCTRELYSFTFQRLIIE